MLLLINTHTPHTQIYTYIHHIYRVFIKYCVFPLHFFNFLNSTSSAAALVFYLPGVSTHTDKKGNQRKARVWNILNSLEKTQYFINTLYIYFTIGFNLQYIIKFNADMVDSINRIYQNIIYYIATFIIYNCRYGRFNHGNEGIVHRIYDIYMYVHIFNNINTGIVDYHDVIQLFQVYCRYGNDSLRLLYV